MYMYHTTHALFAYIYIHLGTYIYMFLITFKQHLLESLHLQRNIVSFTYLEVHESVPALFLVTCGSVSELYVHLVTALLNELTKSVKGIFTLI